MLDYTFEPWNIWIVACVSLYWRVSRDCRGPLLLVKYVYGKQGGSLDLLASTRSARLICWLRYCFGAMSIKFSNMAFKPAMIHQLCLLLLRGLQAFHSGVLWRKLSCTMTRTCKERRRLAQQRSTTMLIKAGSGGAGKSSSRSTSNRKWWILWLKRPEVCSIGFFWVGTPTLVPGRRPERTLYLLCQQWIPR